MGNSRLCVVRFGSGWARPSVGRGDGGCAVPIRANHGPRAERVDDVYVPAAGTGPIALVVLGALIFGAWFPASPADADTTRTARCLRDGVERIVELNEAGDGGLPCEVRYLKPDEDGSVQVLWKANRTPGYCADRFDAFLVKLEGKLSWSCAAPADAEVAALPTSRSIVPSASEVVREDALPGPPAGALPEDGAGVPGPTASRSPSRVLTVPSAPSEDSDASRSPFERLRERLPSGPWTLVSSASDGASVAERCPPGGPSFWNTRDPNRPVFELGREVRFPISLDTVVIGEGPLVLRADERDERATRRALLARSLSLVSDGWGASGLVLEIDFVASGSDGVRSSGDTCRYALGG